VVRLDLGRAALTGARGSAANARQHGWRQGTVFVWAGDSVADWQSVVLHGLPTPRHWWRDEQQGTDRHTGAGGETSRPLDCSWRTAIR
jgi:hypothetical protein